MGTIVFGFFIGLVIFLAMIGEAFGSIASKGFWGLIPFLILGLGCGVLKEYFPVLWSTLKGVAILMLIGVGYMAWLS